MNNIKKTWLNIFNNYNSLYSKEDKKHLDNILLSIENLKKEYTECELDLTIFPKQEHIFKCFQYFELNETKVVILGQDPYHGPNQAIGLCFGVNTKPPPSLKNIAKELKNDIDVELNDYSLEKWAKQGVLLLNASLSVIQGKPASQMGLWNDFTNHIIKELNDSHNSIIFVAWGAFAYEKLKNINTNKHHIIISSHPSPLSVTKKFKQFPSFSSSKPFSKINNILTNNNKKIIEW